MNRRQRFTIAFDSTHNEFDGGTCDRQPRFSGPRLLPLGEEPPLRLLPRIGFGAGLSSAPTRAVLIHTAPSAAVLLHNRPSDSYLNQLSIRSAYPHTLQQFQLIMNCNN